MAHHSIQRLLLCALFSISLIDVSSSAENADPVVAALRDADHYSLRLPDIQTLDQWKARRDILRETLLLRAGLWPEPERCPLNARVFDEKKGDGFSVAKVYFESLPGFFVTGNLYRPMKGGGPFPAIVTPHGHWQYGRLQNGEAGSIPGRCIDFARMGFVVFSIDMIGYNDSFQLPHDPFKSFAQLVADVPVPYESRIFRGDFDFPEAELYGFTLGGLQTWNGIRSVDFLCSLPFVDPERIGVTGASGGASQTIFLMIADDRIKCAAPVNIIGAAKHPGCRCENIPGLWLDASTIELAAAFAPKPLLLMSATEDPWTNLTPEREYPLIRRYYAFYGAEDMVKNVHIAAGHNYNADTRVAVYDWFCRHLKAPNPPGKHPSPIASELKTLGDLRVFPEKMLPENALSGYQVMNAWKISSEQSFATCVPKTANELAAFRKTMAPVMARMLALNDPGIYSPVGYTAKEMERKTVKGCIYRRMTIMKDMDEKSRFMMEVLVPQKAPKGGILLVYPHEYGGLLLSSGEPSKMTVDLMARGYTVYRIEGFSSSARLVPKKLWDSLMWPSAYNLDNNLLAIHEITATVRVIRQSLAPNAPLSIAGLGKCGITATFAAAVSNTDIERTVVDLAGSDPGCDGELITLFRQCGIRRIGDFRTAALLLLGGRLTILNAGPTFDSPWYTAVAKKTGCADRLTFTKMETIMDIAEFF